MKTSLLLAASCALLLSTSSFATEKTLRGAADLSYPPFQFRDSSGNPAGFEIDLTNAICEAIQVKCTYVITSFDAEIPALLSKKVDFISPLGATIKRKKSIAFSDYLYHAPSKLVARKNSGLLPDVASLQGKHIGVLQGSIQEMYARQYWIPKGIDVVTYPDQDSIYQDLEVGRLDGSLVPGAAVTYGFLNKPAGKDFALLGPEVTDDKLFSAGSAYGIRQGDTPTQALINQGIKKIMADGQWEKIKQRYFGDLEMKVNITAP